MYQEFLIQEKPVPPLDDASRRRNAEFNRWLRNEADLPAEAWKRLFVLLIKRLQPAVRNVGLLVDTEMEARSVHAFWTLWGKVGDTAERQRLLDPQLQKIEARPRDPGKRKPSRPIPYDFMHLIYEWLLPTLQREKRAVRTSEGYIRSLLDQMGDKGKKAEVTESLLRDVRKTAGTAPSKKKTSPSEEALMLLAHVFRVSVDTLKREFVEVRKRKPRLVPPPVKNGQGTPPTE